MCRGSMPLQLASGGFLGAAPGLGCSRSLAGCVETVVGISDVASQEAGFHKYLVCAFPLLSPSCPIKSHAISQAGG